MPEAPVVPVVPATTVVTPEAAKPVETPEAPGKLSLQDAKKQWVKAHQVEAEKDTAKENNILSADNTNTSTESKEPVTKQYNLLAKKDKELRTREQEVTTKHKAVEAYESKVKELGLDPIKVLDEVRNVKQDPAKFLESVGWTKDKLLEYWINGTDPQTLLAPQPEDRISKIEKLLEDQNRQRDEQKKQEEALSQAQVQSQVQAQVKEYQAKLDTYLKASDYIFIQSLPNPTNEVIQRLVNAAEAAPGGKIDEKVVIEQLEKELSDQYNRAMELRSKKQGVQSRAEPRIKPAIATLNNNLNSSSPVNTKEMTRDERMAWAKKQWKALHN